MSLVINATTPEGIVVAADSRQTYRNRKGMARIGSDNAKKLFRLNKRISVAITGLAFLPEDGILKNLSKFIDQFKRETDVEKLDVEEAAKKLEYLFNKKYHWTDQLSPEKIKENFKKQGYEVLELKPQKDSVKFKLKSANGQIRDGVVSVDKINLLVSGFNDDGSHQVYTCGVPGEVELKRDSRLKGKEYGATWLGQIDVVSRIVLGWDGRIGNLNFVKEAMQKYGQAEISKELRNLEYDIQWGTMTLQDAIDFCILMIKITSAIQRFSDGIVADPGAIPGVGGFIDVAAITPDKGFFWIQKKQFKTDNKEEGEIN